MHRIADNEDIDVVYVVTPNALHLNNALLAAGAVKVIDAHFGFNCPPGVWRLRKGLAGGGPLLHVGIYCLQATRFLSGEEPT